MFLQIHSPPPVCRQDHHNGKFLPEEHTAVLQIFFRETPSAQSRLTAMDAVSVLRTVKCFTDITWNVVLHQLAVKSHKMAIIISCRGQTDDPRVAGHQRRPIGMSQYGRLMVALTVLKAQLHLSKKDFREGEKDSALGGTKELQP
ncbi:hypothetical protein EPR50_G00014400 [Perca flavescens]|uniref:Uncharacterized protein n=1 Tax=Perca flavescens TaxID=8167 RepID=A0A484DNC0_PERFV|nr:hypothetical protein EPR50_G00014400 [Perca flavescens]